MKKSVRDGLIVGLALFATFFGAGNLIFPPYLGLQSGADWLSGNLGFVASGIIVPVLAVYVISCAGGSVEQMTRKLHPNFVKILLLIIMLFATSVAVPRTGAVTHELGVQALFPSMPAAPILIAFFVLNYYFVNDKNNVIDKIGILLTPALVIILLLIIAKGLFTRVSVPADTGISNAFANGFISGYQTGDLFVSYMVAGVFIADIVRRGYSSDGERNKMTGLAGIVAFACLLVIYTGLLYLGAQGSGIYPGNTDRAELLLSIINTLMGRWGLYAFGIVVALACLTTSIAQFFDGLTCGKLNYKL